jgi:protein-S-isoprenylcysteine O-methyltransferase Ste14
MTASVQKRNVDLSIGYASVALFGASIAVLIWFLVKLVDSPEPYVSFVHREIERATDGRGDARATFNALLILAWGFLHSFMTRPRFKVHLQKILRPHLEPAVYSIVASAGLIAVCLLYRPIPREVYALEGGAALLVRLLFYSAWALFLYCFFHLDALEVVGLRPILRHVDGVGNPSEPFRAGGPFLWVRHPVELAFLVAFWSAPRMTTGHLLFATVMTFYTFLGVDHEDRRMLELHGPAYAEYMKRVPQILPLPH